MQLSTDPQIDLFEEIDRLKRAKNAVILAHYYQEPDIQDVADFVGDSLALAQEAKATDAGIIVFAGVHFMAETAKIVNPTRRVLLPDPDAGCSLADGCPPDAFREFVASHPGHTVISYVNCSAAVKAMTDIVCTSSNAELIINALPADEKILFAPDQHLGRYLIKKTGRDMVLWPGTCMVHEVFSEKKIVELKVRHPNAKVAAHPECPEHVLELADHVGSTSSILKFVQDAPVQEFIIATEPGIIHQMQKLCPDKVFIPAPGVDESCACNECPHMKLNTLEKLYLCLKNEAPEVDVPEPLRQRALGAIERMFVLTDRAMASEP